MARNTKKAPAEAGDNGWKIEESRDEENNNLLFGAIVSHGERTKGKIFRADFYSQAMAAFSVAAHGVRGELAGAQVGFHPYKETGYTTEWGLRPNGAIGVVSSEYEGEDFPKPEDDAWHCVKLTKRGMRLDPRPLQDKINNEWGGFYQSEFHDMMDYMLNGWAILVPIYDRLRPWAEKVLLNNAAVASGDEELIAKYEEDYKQGARRNTDVVITRGYVARNGHSAELPVVLTIEGEELDLRSLPNPTNIEILFPSGKLDYPTRWTGSQMSIDILNGAARRGRRFRIVSS